MCNAYLRWGELYYLSKPDTALHLWLIVEEIVARNLAKKHSNKLRNRFYILKADVYNNMTAVYYPKGNIEKVMELNRSCLKIYKKLENQSGLARALNNLGFLHKNQGEIQHALEAYLESLEIKTLLGDKKGMANTLNNIGVIYQNQGDMEKTLEYAHRSLKIFEELENKHGIAMVLDNLGNIHKTQKDWDLALDFHQRSLEIFEDLGYKRGITKALNNVGHVFANNKNLEQALATYHRSLSISQELGNRKGEAHCLINIATVESRGANYKGALATYRTALETFKAMKDKKWTTASLTHVGRMLYELGETTEARKYCEQSLALAQELGFPIEIQKSAYLMFQINKKAGEHRASLEHYELYIVMKDSISNEATQKASIRKQTLYEFEKAQLVKEHKEKETLRVQAEAITRRDNLQYSIVLICLLAIGGLVAMLGRLKLSEKVAEGLIFFAFLIFFEFALVLADPLIEQLSEGAPGVKLLFNASIAALIFPLHAFIETNLKSRLST